MIPEAENLVFNEYYDGKLAEVHLAGSLEQNDFRALLSRLRRLIQKRDKIRLLLQFHHFRGGAAGLSWDQFDLLRSLNPLRRVERLAVVGDGRAKTALSLFARPFCLAHTRFFPTEQARGAQRWIDEGLASIN